MKTTTTEGTMDEVENHDRLRKEEFDEFLNNTAAAEMFSYVSGPDYPYWLYDPRTGRCLYFSHESMRDYAADELVASMRRPAGWNHDVRKISVGIVTHLSVYQPPVVHGEYKIKRIDSLGKKGGDDD